MLSIDRLSDIRVGWRFWIGLCLLSCHAQNPADDAVGEDHTAPPRTLDDRRQGDQPSSTPCDGHSPGSDPTFAATAEATSTFKSAHLNSVAHSLTSAVSRASGAMRGVHRTLTPPGIAGVDFVLVRLALTSGSCPASLSTALASQEADPATAKVSQLADRSADAIDRAFVGWRRSTNSSGVSDPTPALAAEIAESVDQLRLYATAGTRGTSHVSGIAMVDETTREAVWIFARVVKPIVERRR